MVKKYSMASVNTMFSSFSVILLMRWMIGFTEIKKGSEYGHGKKKQ